MQGLNVTVFSDVYPEGHQTGVSIIQHGSRVAANGDLRLEASPGQWSPMPKAGHKKVDLEKSTISQQLWYPDSSRNRKGFNPVLYPNLHFTYNIEVEVLAGSTFKITVNIDQPLPEEFIGKVGFNFELFPGELFGKSWLLDSETGIFPVQPNGPIADEFGENISRPMASGRKLLVAPECDNRRISIESLTGMVELRDGRSNHNNSWFIVREALKAGATKKAVEWIITPNVIEGWVYKPVIQVSQIGYHPKQEKKAIVELDPVETDIKIVQLYKLSENGKTLIKEEKPKAWGDFLRYRYYQFDFSEITTPGMYLVRYGDIESNPFKIDKDVYNRNVWQPVLEYFLPVQMCHMRVNEKYRVWHDYCHLDDALMAPADTNHFDGYRQGSSSLTDFESLQQVPGLAKGGWHDAGDFDLRVESQIGTIWKLALMIEEFGLDYDATTIYPEKQLVEIHQPDGISDAIQQIEHGLESVLGGYRSLGRLYRGIICQDLRQYVMLGDASAMTDNLKYNPGLSETEKTADESGKNDDRWVFTEENAWHELQVAGGLAAASRVLEKSNPELALECIETAEQLFKNAKMNQWVIPQQIIALTELYLTTKKDEYRKQLITNQGQIINNLSRCGWAAAHVMSQIDDKDFNQTIEKAVAEYQKNLLKEQQEDSPYGVPYKPRIWGAGWDIQRFGVEQYFFYKAWPEIVDSSLFVNALNFILGVHPGSNTASFASGVGSESVTTAYGFNRADWSFIPGGVVSGTALIRPDLPELKEWPFFWQQTEYVMGGGSTDFMFLVLAVDNLFR